MRILIRVPEAYLLLYPLSTSRPGLVVLDADARRVHSIALPLDAATIAKQLRAAADSKVYEGVEMFRVIVSGDSRAFRRAIDELDAVEDSTIQRGELRIAISEGELLPTKIDALAKKHGVTLKWRNPVRVALAAPTKKSRLAMKALPGVWYTDASSAYVVDVLLDPKAFGANVSDLESRVFKLPGVSKGGRGAGVARAPLSVAGVLSVFPDIFGGSELVIARKGKIRWADVKRAFKKSGVSAKMKR